MKKISLVFAVLFCTIVSGFSSDGKNSCVNCHSRITKVDSSRPAHSFVDWENSIHAKRGIACDACHGGNPAAPEADKAHENISKSSDPESSIYFNKIPDSCGVCHARELEGFKESAHYQELHRSGKGPNCVTCHGSMASHVMAPRELESVCTLCHRRPTKAYASLLTLQATQKTMGQLRKELKESKSQGLNVSQQSDDLVKVEQSYREILKVWHSFDMEKVLTMSHDLNRRIRNTFHEIELKKNIKK